MNQLRIPKLFILLIIFILWACDQTIDEVSPESRHSWERKTISVSDSENLGNILKDIMNSPSLSQIRSSL